MANTFNNGTQDRLQQTKPFKTKKLKKNFVKTNQRSENPSVGTLSKGRIVTYIGYDLMAWACL